jgi:hypothetical protein
LKVNAIILANQRDSLVPPRFVINTQETAKKTIHIYTNIYKGESVITNILKEEREVQATSPGY